MTPDAIVQIFDVFARDKPAHLPAPASSPGLRYLSLEDVDRALCVSGLREPFFALSNVDKGVVPFDSWPFHAKETGCADPRKVLSEILKHGTTLVLRHAHVSVPSIRALALALQLDRPRLSVEVNGYLTPPNAQGIRAHHDPRDTILVQQHGSKHWRAWARLDTHSKEAPNNPHLEVVLRPGDALFIPSGCIHAAATQDDYSLHFTIGMLDEEKLSSRLAVRPRSGIPVRVI